MSAARVTRLRPGATLPRLSDRRTRVRLLGWSYWDAAEGSDDGGRGSRPSSRAPGRNPELWRAGSYWDLERVLDGLPSRVWFYAAWCGGTFDPERGSGKARFREHPLAVAALVVVSARMPADVFVPAVISEAAGYLPGDAKRWQDPAFKRRAA